MSDNIYVNRESNFCMHIILLAVIDQVLFIGQHDWGVSVWISCTEDVHVSSALEIL